MRKIAFIFPGQGSQQVGMGKELAENYASAHEIFSLADRALGFPVSKLCWEGPEEKLKETSFTQPAVLTVSIAALCVLQENGIKPAAVAGHSLGEYAALVAADSIAFSDAVMLVRKRGEFMQNAVPLGVGTMAAVMGLNSSDVIEVCQESKNYGIVEPANFNCPGQVVIAGEVAAVEKAAELAKQKGAKKIVFLPVSAPFHTSMLKKAGELLGKELDKVEIKKPNIPVVANIHGKILKEPDEIRQGLIDQVSSQVKWEDCMLTMLELGINCFVEVGPGKVLTGFAKKIAKDIEVFNVEDETSLQKTLVALKGGNVN